MKGKIKKDLILIDRIVYNNQVLIWRDSEAAKRSGL